MSEIFGVKKSTGLAIFLIWGSLLVLLGVSSIAEQLASEEPPQEASSGSKALTQESEIQVNTTTANDQGAPAIAGNSSGRIAIVWEDDSNGDSDVRVQRFDSDGSVLGSEILANSDIAGQQTAPQLAVTPSSELVVVWESDASGGTDDGLSIQMRRIDSVGNAQGSDLQVNTHTPYPQKLPSVDSDGSGNFVVVWQSLGTPSGESEYDFAIRGQRFDGAGLQIGSEFRVNSGKLGAQKEPEVGSLLDGSFVVVWQSAGDGDGDELAGIRGRRFASDGQAIGVDFHVNEITDGNQLFPDIGVAPNGDFLVVWQSDTGDGDGSGIKGRRFMSDSTPISSEFSINTFTTGQQTIAGVSLDGNGDFVVVWTDSARDTAGTGTIAQLFASNGSRLGEELIVNSWTTGNQGRPQVAATAVGDFRVVWESSSSPGTDDSGLSVQSAKFRLPRADPSLSISADNGETLMMGDPLGLPGDSLTITVRVDNAGLADALGLEIRNVFPEELSVSEWSCDITGDASCEAGTEDVTGITGTEDIALLIDVGVGASVTFTINAEITSGTEAGPFQNEAELIIPPDLVDTDLNNTATLDITVEPGDYGDAPNGLMTAVDGDGDGPRHFLPTAVYFATDPMALPDEDQEGQASEPANADDLNGMDDEDGVTLPTELVTCKADGTVRFDVVGGGVLNGWVDWNGDREWQLPDEQVFTEEVLVEGFTILPLPVPCDATLGTTYARFRISSAGGDGPGGRADDGEVEDYSITVTSKANITLTKTDDQLEATPGEPILYTIVATNLGPSHAVAQIIDVLPADLEDGAEWTCTPSSMETLCTADGVGSIDEEITLPSGEHVTFVIDAMIRSSATGLLSNVVTLESDILDPIEDRSATDQTMMVPTTDLEVTKDCSPSKVVPGQELACVITVVNHGPSDAPNVLISDDFPAAIQGAAWTCSSENGGVCADDGPPDVTVSLPAGSSVVLDATGVVDVTSTPGDVTNIVSASHGADPGSPSSASATVTVVAADFGDAPDASVLMPASASLAGDSLWHYPTTLAENGARHQQGTALFLGATPGDAELDGQPTDDAVGDGGDEDGVEILAPFATCEMASLNVTASVDGKLDGWIDFNRNGVWQDAGEKVFDDLSISGGGNLLTVDVPCDAETGVSFARFRLSSQGGLDPIGFADDGEVEDYMIEIRGLDWGDAPDDEHVSMYPTLRANDGARHAVGPLFLGAGIDAEVDGLQSEGAEGDDNAVGDPVVGAPAVGDDEDGVSWSGSFSAGEAVTLDVEASGAGELNAWIDFNDDGDWDDPDEQVFTNRELIAGTNELSFAVPGGVIGTPLTLARFRFSSEGGLDVGGYAKDGEVEDYAISLVSNADLTITKTDGVGTATPGEMLTYTITVTNAGPSNVDEALVNDVFPPALLDPSWTCSGAGGGICRDAADGNLVDESVILPVGGSVTFEVDGLVDPSAQGTLVNTATVSSDVPDPDSDNNTATDDDTVLVPISDLGVSKSADRAVVLPKAEVEYTITVTNSGPSDAVGALVTDHFPTGFGTNVEWFCTAGDGAICNPNGSGSSLIETVSLKVGSELVFTATGTVDPDAEGDLVNTASVQILGDPNGLNDMSDSVTVTIQGGDFGDAPNADLDASSLPSNGNLGRWYYPTRLEEDGARHIVVDGIRLGASLDYELDGEPDLDALGDGEDDGNGVVFNTDLVACDQEAQVTVFSSVGGYLSAWLDFNRDGDWDDAFGEEPSVLSEQIFVDHMLAPGGEMLTFKVPCEADPGPTFARFRFSTISFETAEIDYSGLADNGEVEDYRLEILGLDFGDAESPGFPTLLVEDGARHVLGGTLFLGSSADSEPDGQPIDGDDSDGNDDEDGIAFESEPLEPGALATIRVFASQPGGFLNAWMDWNGSGAWEDGEQIANNWAVSGDPLGDPLEVSVPPDALSGAMIASRFRLSSAMGLDITGLAPDGEVEDHLVAIVPVADLTVEKELDTDEPVPGTWVTWTITVTNDGPQGVEEVDVIDDFAEALDKLDTIRWSCSGTNGGSCTAGPIDGVLNDRADLPYAGVPSSVIYEVEALIKPSAVGPLRNTAQATLPLGFIDLDAPSLDRRTEEFTLTKELMPENGLDVMIDAPAAGIPGTDLTYSVVLTNMDFSDAPSVRIVHNSTLADGFTWDCTVTGQAACGAGPGEDRLNQGGNIDFDLSLPAGTSITFSFDGEIPSGALMVLEHSFDVSGETRSEQTALNPVAELVIKKYDELDPAMQGLDPIYTVELTNNGPSDAADVRVMEIPPAQISATGFDAGCAPDSVYPECKLGVLAAGVTRQFKVLAEVTYGEEAFDAENRIQVTMETAGTITADTGETDGSASENTCVYGRYSDFPMHRDLFVDGPPVVAAKDGFFVVWESQGDAEDELTGLRARRLSSEGLFVETAPIQVNSYTTGRQQSASVAPLNDGGFVVTWESYGSDGGDQDLSSVQGRVFDAMGQPAADQFQINAISDSRQSRPDVAVTDSGAFLVVWDTLGIGSDAGLGVLGRLYGSDGSALSGEIHINTFTSGSQRRVKAAGLPGGGFVATWQSDETSQETSSGVLAQIFDSMGGKVGGEIQVNAYTTGIQGYPAIASDIFGNFVVVWESEGSYGPDLNGSSIQMQRFGADGTKTGNQIQANSYAPGNQTRPSVALANDGNVHVSWTVDSGIDGDGTGIFYRAFGPDGIGLENDRLVNSTHIGDQGDSSIAVQSEGDPLVVGLNPSLHCAPGRSTVFGKRYRVQKADLQMRVEPRFAEVVPGMGSAAFELIVTNNSSIRVNNARVIDNLPPQMVGPDWSCSATDGSECSEAQGEGDIDTLISLDPGGEASFLVTGEIAADASEHVVNEARVIVGSGISDPVISNNSDSAEILLDPTVDLTVESEMTDPILVPGETVFIPGQEAPITFEVEVSNAGPTFAGGVLVETLFPESALSCTWGCAPDPGSSCESGIENQPLSEQSRDIQDLVDLPPEGRILYTVECLILPSARGTLEIETELALSDPIPDPEVAFEDTNGDDNRSLLGPLSLAPMTDLIVSLEEPQGVVSSGGDITYIYTVSNIGSSTAESVSLTAFLPAGVTLIPPVEGSETSEGCAELPEVDDQATCEIGPIGPGEQAQVHLEVTIPLGLEGTVLTSSGSVATFTEEVDYANNLSNEASTTVRPEIKVDTALSDGVAEPAIAALADGSFVVVWESDVPGVDASNQYEIRARLYDSNGLPRGDDFLVSDPAALQFRPDVAMAPDGSFLVVWDRQIFPESDDPNIVGRYFDPDGNPLTAPFQINSTTPDAQIRPAVVYSPRGEGTGENEFVIVWESKIDGIAINDIRGRRWSLDSGFLSFEILVNDSTEGDQLRPSIAILNAEGDFVVGWESTEPSSESGDTDGSSIHGRRFTATGNPYGPQFQVNNYELGDQEEVAVAATAGNEAAFIWKTAHSTFDPYGTSIHQRIFCRDGSPSKDVDVIVNANGFGNGDQTQPTISFLGGDEFLAGWKSSAKVGDNLVTPQLKASSGGIFIKKGIGIQTPLDTEVVADGEPSGLFHPDVVTAGSFYIGVWQSGDSILARRVTFTVAPFAGDADQDGVIDECDVCQGLDDDNMDLNNNDIPDCLEDQTLTLTFEGTGAGAVTSVENDFVCRTEDVTCIETFDVLEMVRLEAEADEEMGSVFLGWSGDQCEGTDPVCTVEITNSPSVKANFTHQDDIRTLSWVTDGEPGRIVPDPSSLGCGTNCSLYTVGTEVLLQAVGDPGSILREWSPTCGCGESEDFNVCPVVLNDNVSCLATFELRKYDVTISIAGAGTVTPLSVADGSCGPDCYQYFHGSRISFLADPGDDPEPYRFTGWSGGGCTGDDPLCSDIPVTSDLTITAEFTPESELHDLRVERMGTGTGRVYSIDGDGLPDGNIDCGPKCRETYKEGEGATLIAEPNEDSEHVGWSESCPNGLLTMTEEVICTALFDRKTPVLRIIPQGSGLGTVTSFPDGEINCTKLGGTCVAEYEYGEEITLISDPSEDPDSRFGGWKDELCGPFGAAEQCPLTLTDDTIVLAKYYLANATSTLTVFPNGDGEGEIDFSPTGLPCGLDGVLCYEYDTHEEVTLTAEPEIGTTFVGWSGSLCAGAGTGPCTLGVLPNSQVSATFILDRHELTVERAGDGFGSVRSLSDSGIQCPGDCSQIYDFGTVVVLEADAEDGSTFTGWSGACEGEVEDSCPVTMDQAQSVTANFALGTETLTVTTSGTGSGSVVSDELSGDLGIECPDDCDETYVLGTTVVLTPTAQTGSVFMGWLDDVASPCSGLEPCTVVMNGAVHAEAVFERESDLRKVSVFLQGGQGTIGFFPDNVPSCGTDCRYYPYGTGVSLSVEPDEGYSFDSWSPNCSGGQVFTINDFQCVATLTLDEHTLFVDTDGSGQGIVESQDGQIACGTECSGTYPYGTTVVLEPRALGDSTFTGWSGGGCEGQVECTLEVTDTETVTAEFTDIDNVRTLTLDKLGKGIVQSEPAGIQCDADDPGTTVCTQDYAYGDGVTLTATEVEGWTFAGWSGEDGCPGLEPCFVSMTAHRKVTAFFTIDRYTVTVENIGSGTGRVTSSPAGIDCGMTCSAEFDFGEMVTLTAQDDGSGSVFTGWFGACSGRDVCKVVVTGEMFVQAQWTDPDDLETLTIVQPGDGSGRVTTNPMAIDCPNISCSEDFPRGDTVQLVATAEPGSTFEGWTGSGCGDTVTLSGDLICEANFSQDSYRLQIFKGGSGNGRIVSSPAGIDCGDSCFEDFPSRTEVVLVDEAGPGSTFSGWSEDSDPDCMDGRVEMNGPLACIAIFDLAYELTLGKTGDGDGTVLPDPIGDECESPTSDCWSFAYESEVSLQANPVSGSVLKEWIGDPDCVDGRVSMLADRDCTAVFATLRNLVVEKTGNGSGTVVSETAGAEIEGINCGPDCSEGYDETLTVKLTASPSEGSEFNGWSGGCCSGTATSCTFDTTESCTVYADFSPERHLLEVTHSGTGEGTVSSNPSGILCTAGETGDCLQRFDYPTMVTLTASPEDDSEFTGWSGADCPGLGSCEVEMTQARVVDAEFTSDGDLYQLLVNVTDDPANGIGGTVTSEPDGIHCGEDCTNGFKVGVDVTLTATPNEASVFLGWTDGICGPYGMEPCVVEMEMQGNLSVTASFGPKRLLLTVDVDGMGTVTSTDGLISCESDCTAEYDYPEMVTLNAVEDVANHFFTGWSGACAGLGDCIVTMTEAKNVQAVFTPDNELRDLTVMLDGNGAGLVTSNPEGISCPGSCTNRYPVDSTITLTATPAADSDFVGWTGGGCGEDLECVVSLAATTAVTAEFELKRYTLDVEKIGEGDGRVYTADLAIDCGTGPGCMGTFNHGEEVVLKVEPDEDSSFLGWSGGGCSGIGDCRITMLGSVEVQGEFALVPSIRILQMDNSGGGGVVTSDPAGLNCGSTCEVPFGYEEIVRLDPQPDANFRFGSWGGDSDCLNGELLMDGNRNCSVSFVPTAELTVLKDGDGAGTIVSSPTGHSGSINCNENPCSATFDLDAVVVLTASAEPGNRFDGWTNAPGCSDMASCTVTLDSAKSVTATFAAVEGSQVLTVGGESGNGEGSVSSNVGDIQCPEVSCSDSFAFNTQVVLNPNPATGSVFTEWTGSCSGSAGCSVTMNQDHDVQAVFTLTRHQLTVNVNGDGQVISDPEGIDCQGGSCAQEFDYGTEVRLEASPSLGSRFVTWSGGGCGTDPVCTVTVLTATTVTAQFAMEEPRTLSVTTVGDGRVSSNPGGIDCPDVTCEGDFQYGATVSLSAQPAVGFELVGWTGPCTDPGDGTCEVVMDQDRSVRADFEEVDDPDQLTLEFSGDCEGSVSSEPTGIACSNPEGGVCTALFRRNEEVTLTATPADGCAFAGWTGGECSDINPCDLTVTSDLTINARFQQSSYELTVEVMGSGRVESTPGTLDCTGTCAEAFDFGTSVVLEPHPDEGWKFIEWMGACSGAGACSVTMTEARQVVAKFEPESFSLDVEIDLEGDGSGDVVSMPGSISCPDGSCSEMFDFGSVVKLTAEPDLGSRFTSWGGDCAAETSEQCELTIEGDSTVSVRFDQQPEQVLTIAKSGAGDGVVSSQDGEIICGGQCSASYEFGTDVTLEVTPDSGSEFVGWSGLGVDCPGTGPCTVEMDATRVVTAEFRVVQWDVELIGTGDGDCSIEYFPGGAVCPNDCAVAFEDGEGVTLTPTAEPGSTFIGWTSLPCSADADVCQFEVGQDLQIGYQCEQDRSLTVGKEGEGTVTSAPSGIDCGDNCTASFVHGSEVVLIPTPAAGWFFDRWDGPGDCLNGRVTMSTDIATCTAIFTSSFRLSVELVGTGSGDGQVIFGDIDCPDVVCEQDLPQGTSVNLTAIAGDTADFIEWSGEGDGGADCLNQPFNLEADTHCIARFDLKTFPLTVVKDEVLGSSGRVISELPVPPAPGIDCGNACVIPFDYGTVVRLVATPDEGSSFLGWSGAGIDCPDTGPCEVTVDMAKNVTAHFGIRTYGLLVQKIGDGDCTVSSALGSQIDCGEDCEGIYSNNEGNDEALQIEIGDQTTFTGWPEACFLNAGLCFLDMNRDIVLPVECQLDRTLSINKPGEGSGSVTSTPIGEPELDCGETCAGSFAHGTEITMQHEADVGSIFQQWAGAEDCEDGVVTMTENLTCEAVFVPARNLNVTVTDGNGFGSVTSSADGSAGGGVACPDQCAESYAIGTLATLTAEESSGSVFSHWVGEGCSPGSTEKSILVDMSEHRVCSAVFALVRNRLEVVFDGSGTGEVLSNPGPPDYADGVDCPDQCTGFFPTGDTIQLTATADAESRCLGVTGDGCDGTCDLFTVQMNVDRECTVIFTKIYPLVVDHLGTGSGTVTSTPQGLSEPSGIDCTDGAGVCTDYFDDGTPVQLVASPDTEGGSVFVGWQGDCAPAGQVTMAGPRTCSAIFNLETFLFTVSKGGTGGGTVVSTDPGGLIDCGLDCLEEDVSFGTPVTLDPQPDPDSRFVGWEPEPDRVCDIIDNTVTITERTGCKAIFNRQVSLTVAIDPEGGGRVTSDPGEIDCPGICSDEFDQDTDVELSAAPAAGYAFDAWDGDCSGTDVTLTVLMDTNKNCTAKFVQLFEITVSKGGTGDGTIVSQTMGYEIDCGADCNEENVPSGTMITLDPQWDANSRFVDWEAEPGLVCNIVDNTVTVTERTGCKAIFNRQVSLTVAIDPEGGGGVTSDPGDIDCPGICSDEFDQNTDVELSAAPAAGYAFDAWDGDCSGSAATITVPMDNSKDCMAKFVQVFEITVSKGGTGDGTIVSQTMGYEINCGEDCNEENVPSGTMIMLDPQPDADSRFVDWEAEPGLVCNIVDNKVTVTERTGCKAIFNRQFVLDVTIDPEGGGDVTGAPGEIDCPDVACLDTYDQGSEITLTAVEADGYQFVSWDGAGCTGTSLSIQVTMEDERTCTANFRKVWTLSITNLGGGQVTSSDGLIDCLDDCDAIYPDGTPVTLEATPNSGYRFGQWTGDDCTGTSSTFMLTMDANKSCEAVFIPRYDLNVSINGQGTVVTPGDPSQINCPGDCDETYDGGDEITLTASPEDGYVFDAWSNCSSAVTPTINVTMSEHRTCIANFILAPKTLTVINSGGGQVTADSGAISCPGVCEDSYPHGTEVELTAAPAMGFRFDGWSRDCTGSNLTTSVVMEEIRLCEAVFVRTPTLTVESIGGGTVTSTVPDDRINCGDSCTGIYDVNTGVTLSAAPDEGKQLDSWSEGCSGTDSTVDITMDDDKLCRATFVDKPSETYTLTVVFVGGASGTVTLPGISPCSSSGADPCVGTYTEGTEIMLTGAPGPPPTNALLTWAGFGDCLDGRVTMTEDIECIANFETPLFADGFEGGDLTQWTSSAPTLPPPPADIEGTVEGTAEGKKKEGEEEESPIDNEEG